MKPSLFKYVSGSLCVLLLAACATPSSKVPTAWQAQAEIADFAADGRLAVKINEKGSYANFDWTHQNQVQTIDVNTPLGNTVGQLCQDSKGALAVNSKNEVFYAATAPALSEQLLGFALPVEYLHVWASGQRVDNAAYQVLPNGRLQQFEWTISRQLRADGTPKVLLLESTKLTLKLVFDHMEMLPADATAPKLCAARVQA